MQHGGVQIVDVHRMVHRLKAEIVGGAVHRASLDASTGQHIAEALIVVIAAVLHLIKTANFHHRRAPNSPPITTSVSFNIPLDFRSCNSAAIGGSA